MAVVQGELERLGYGPPGPLGAGAAGKAPSELKPFLGE